MQDPKESSSLSTPVANGVGSGNYIKFIAYLQIIGIVLVVFSHSMHEYPDGEFGRSLLLTKMLHNFRMPLFMFVSGFLMYYTGFLRGGQKEFKEFALSKVKRLLLPFFVLSIITFLPRSLMSSFADEHVSLDWQSMLYSIVHGKRLSIPFFWFLQASFFLLVVCFGWLKLSRRWNVSDNFTFRAMMIVAVFIQISPTVPIHYFWSFDKVCLYAPYFVLGIVYSRYRENIDRVVPWTSPLFYIPVTLIWCIGFTLVVDTPYVVIFSYFGIAMCISLAKGIVARGYTFLDHLVGTNYMIFLLSWFCNVATQQVLSHYTDFPWWVYSIMSLIAGIYVPWLCYKWMQRHAENRAVKTAAFLLGQSLNQRKLEK